MSSLRATVLTFLNLLSRLVAVGCHWSLHWRTRCAYTGRGPPAPAQMSPAGGDTEPSHWRSTQFSAKMLPLELLVFLLKILWMSYILSQTLFTILKYILSARTFRSATSQDLDMSAMHASLVWNECSGNTYLPGELVATDQTFRHRVTETKWTILND